MILFYISGMVILTLFINGLTAGFVLRKLGLANESLLEKKMMIEFLAQVDTHADELFEEVKSHGHHL